jgi:hypothetical protein
MKRDLLSVGLAATVMVLFAGNALGGDHAQKPDTVAIAALSELYEPVEFDHAMHADLADCARCHHHTTGTGPASPSCGHCHPGAEPGADVSCRGCHAPDPFSAQNLKKLEEPGLYHLDKPGLKAAYHLKCLSCHRETDAPTGCQDCHAMTEAGQRRFYAGPFRPGGDFVTGAGALHGEQHE